MLASCSLLKPWVRLPLTIPPGTFPAGKHVMARDRDPEDPWQWWDVIRTACESHVNLGVGMYKVINNHMNNDSIGYY